ncbi:hypothetical protein DACRYDRAFT_18596 [Dacryopinax primogenitus]|uniref:Alpha-type protein kinase domain-containing protein n=1 Tax=Dacryopinax primogenitus (strain DJM 731) TaxID=1858805 RepID=M5FNL1_DACPD|nr:uncharacterized protein DACRYDRAFT_18596 [Dacryopinax primogenitus]EJT97635.1 hypothetical protein DACRYDRAFT_18596 [Dacryopinax primogenitus]
MNQKLAHSAILLLVHRVSQLAQRLGQSCLRGSKKYTGRLLVPSVQSMKFSNIPGMPAYGANTRPTLLGYNSNHGMYPQQHQLVKMAVSAPWAEVMRVDTSMQHLVEGKNRAKQLGNTSKWLTNVPATLVPTELKQYIFTQLHCKIQQDMYHFLFQLDYFELCGLGLADLEKDPTCSALYQQCVKTHVKNSISMQVFMPNHLVEAFLVIEKEVWPAVSLWIEGSTEGLSHSNVIILGFPSVSGPDVSTKVAGHTGVMGAVTAGLGGGSSAIKQPLISQMPPCPTKHMVWELGRSPDNAAVDHALRASDYSKVTKANGASTYVIHYSTFTNGDSVKSIMAHGLFLPMPMISWNELISGSVKLVINYKGDRCHSVLQVNKDLKKMLGPPRMFKMAHSALLTLNEFSVKWEEKQPFALGHPTKVAAKHYYVCSKPRGSCHQVKMSVELMFLQDKVNLLYWVTALHGLVKYFVEDYITLNPNSRACTLELPDTCMVLGGLFQYGQDSPQECAGLVTLIEEKYQKMFKKAFVLDYQGEHRQLHKCNEYCVAFKLEPLHDPNVCPEPGGVPAKSLNLPDVEDIIKDTLAPSPVEGGGVAGKDGEHTGDEPGMQSLGGPHATGTRGLG